MKKNDHDIGAFVRLLDRTAEKSFFLRLPCILLMILILLVSKLAALFRAENSDRPVTMRYAALVCAAAFMGMIFTPLSEMVSITAAAEIWDYGSKWSVGYALNEQSEITVDRNVKYSGEYSIKIANKGYNDASVKKTLAVSPYTKYRISAAVHYTDYFLSPASSVSDSGASIGVDGMGSSAAYHGASWQRLVYEFETGSENKVTVLLRNGSKSGTCKGNAWFSDVVIEQDMSTSTNEWKVLALVFRNVDVAQNLDGEASYVRNMDDSDVSFLSETISRVQPSIEDISGGLMRIKSVETYGTNTPVKALGYSDAAGYFLDTDSFEVSSTLDYYLSIEPYDQIILISPIGDITKNMYDMGCPDYKGVNVCRVNCRPGDYISGYGSTFPESIFVRQILRSLEDDSRIYDPATPSVSDSFDYGYGNYSDEGRAWFTAYMRRQLPGNLGLDPRVYKRGSSTANYVPITGNMDVDDTIDKHTGLEPVDMSKVTTRAGDGSVTLSWEHSVGAQSYNIYVRYLNGTVKLAGTTNGNTYTVSGLTNDTLYGFLIRSAANGEQSSANEKDYVYDTPHTAFKHVYFPSGIAVSRGGQQLASGDIIAYGDILTVTGAVPEGMTIMINGTPVLSGATYSVGNADVVVSIDKMPDDKYPWETTSLTSSSSGIVTDPIVTTATSSQTSQTTQTSYTSQTYYPIVTYPTSGTWFSDPVFIVTTRRPVVTETAITTAGRIPEPIYPGDDTEEIDEYPAGDDYYSDIELALYSSLTKLSKGKSRMMTRKDFFDTSTDIRLMHTTGARANALSAAEEINDGHLVIYHFQISAFRKGTDKPAYFSDNGYLTFEMPVPRKMVSAIDSLMLYDTDRGYPTPLDSEIFTDTDGSVKIRFTVDEPSTLMLTVNGEDISSNAGLLADGVMSDMGAAAPVSLTPSALLPRGAGSYGRRRRFHIVRIRKKKDVMHLR